MANKIYSFRAIIEPDKPSGYHGFVPSLPGCHTDGKTIEETKKNLKEAMTGILECMIENNVPIPQEDNSVEFIHQIELTLPHAKAPSLQAQRAC